MLTRKDSADINLSLCLVSAGVKGASRPSEKALLSSHHDAKRDGYHSNGPVGFEPSPQWRHHPQFPLFLTLAIDEKIL